MTWDCFISYSSLDRATVQPVVEELAGRGVSLWYDGQKLQTFDDELSRRISEGVAGSRITIAFVSDTYLASEACRWELLESLKRGGLQRLLLVVLGQPRQLLPLLRENVQYRLAEDGDTKGLVDAVVERLLEPPGPAPAQAVTQWWPEEWPGTTFAGRFGERIRLLSALTHHVGAASAANRAFDRAQIVGMGGQGKTMLALQFARDFQHRFRAVARFDAGADRYGHVGASELDVLDDLLGQVLAWLESAGQRYGVALLLPERRAPGAWEQARTAAEHLVASLGGEVLWIVDDLPSGLSEHALGLLLCPGAGWTIVTTRGHDYADHFDQATIDLHGLDPDEAVYLLARGDGRVIEEESDVLRRIGAEVDHHALALAVLSRRIAAWSARGVLERLQGQPAAVVQELERAAARMGLLSGGHRASIVATLAMSVDELTLPESRTVLLLAVAWPTSRPIPFDLLLEVVGPGAIEGCTELITAGLAEKADAGSLLVHALVCGLVQYRGDAATEPELDGIRLGAARWLWRGLDRERLWAAADLGAVLWHLLQPAHQALDGDDQLMAADALMAMARLPMRHRPQDLAGDALVAYLEDRVQWARLAESLSDGESRARRLGAGRAQAMQGLLRIRQAGEAATHQRRLALATDGRRLLDLSMETRLPVLAGSDDPEDLDEIARAYFNFGRLVTVAQIIARQSPEEAAAALDSAAEAYGTARDTRHDWLREGTFADERALENLASCYRGLAIVAFTRAMYLPGTRATKRATLAAAEQQLAPARVLTHQARQLRQRVPSGVVTADMTKDLQLQAKLRMAARALELLDGRQGEALLSADLASLDTALDPTVAAEVAGSLVPWGATDAEGLDDGRTSGFVDLARLRVNEARGGRGETASRTLHDYRERDLPALRRTLEGG